MAGLAAKKRKAAHVVGKRLKEKRRRKQQDLDDEGDAAPARTEEEEDMEAGGGGPEAAEERRKEMEADARQFLEGLKTDAPMEAIRSMAAKLQKRDGSQQATVILEVGCNGLDLLKLLEGSYLHRTTELFPIMTVIWFLLEQCRGDEVDENWYSMAVEMARKLVSLHARSLNAMMTPNNSIALRLLAFHIYTACAELLGKEAAERIDLNHSLMIEALNHSSSRLNPENDLRGAFVELMNTILVWAGPAQRRQLLERRHPLVLLFPKLVNDHYTTTIAVFDMMREQVLLAPTLSKSLKTRLFGLGDLKQLLHLLSHWIGPQSKADKYNEIGEEEVPLEHRKKVSSAAHAFFTVLCTDYKYGLVFKDPSLGLAGQNLNPILFFILRLLDLPWTEPLKLQLTLSVMKACPDLTWPLLTFMGSTLRPRPSPNWTKAMDFLVEVLEGHQLEDALQEGDKWGFDLPARLLLPPDVAQEVMAPSWCHASASVRQFGLRASLACIKVATAALKFYTEKGWNPPGLALLNKMIPQTPELANCWNKAVTLWTKQKGNEEAIEDNLIDLPECWEHLQIILEVEKALLSWKEAALCPMQVMADIQSVSACTKQEPANSVVRLALDLLAASNQEDNNKKCEILVPLLQLASQINETHMRQQAARVVLSVWPGSLPEEALFWLSELWQLAVKERASVLHMLGSVSSLVDSQNPVLAACLKIEPPDNHSGCWKDMLQRLQLWLKPFWKLRKKKVTSDLSCLPKRHVLRYVLDEEAQHHKLSKSLLKEEFPWHLWSFVAHLTLTSQPSSDRIIDTIDLALHQLAALEWQWEDPVAAVFLSCDKLLNNFTPFQDNVSEGHLTLMHLLEKMANLHLFTSTFKLPFRRRFLWTLNQDVRADEAVKLGELLGVTGEEACTCLSTFKGEVDPVLMAWLVRCCHYGGAAPEWVKVSSRLLKKEISDEVAEVLLDVLSAAQLQFWNVKTTRTLLESAGTSPVKVKLLQVLLRGHQPSLDAFLNWSLDNACSSSPWGLTMLSTAVDASGDNLDPRLLHLLQGIKPSDVRLWFQTGKSEANYQPIMLAVLNNTMTDSNLEKVGNWTWQLLHSDGYSMVDWTVPCVIALFKRLAHTTEGKQRFLQAAMQTVILQDKSGVASVATVDVLGKELASLLQQWELLKDITSEQFMLKFVKASLRLALAENYQDQGNAQKGSPLMLGALASFCHGMKFGSAGETTLLQLDLLHKLLTSHSRFLPLLLDHSQEEEKVPRLPVTEAVIELMIALVQAQPQLAEQRLIPVFLGSYGATLSRLDQLLLKLLWSYEKAGAHFPTQLKPPLWGPAAMADAEEAKINDHSARKSASAEFLALINTERMEHTTLCFPLDLSLQLGEAVVKEDSSIYDPRFLIPALIHALSPDHPVPIFRVIECGALGVITAALSSGCVQMRTASCTALHLFRCHLQNIRMAARERQIWLRLLDFLSSGMQQGGYTVPPRLPFVVTLYLARLAQELNRSQPMMMAPLARFLTSRRSLDCWNVPDFFSMFNSTATRAPAEGRMHRAWMLAVLRDGVRLRLDLLALRKRHILKAVQGWAASPMATKEGPVQVLGLLASVAQVPGGASALLHRGATLSWVRSLVVDRPNITNAASGLVLALWCYRHEGKVAPPALLTEFMLAIKVLSIQMVPPTVLLIAAVLSHSRLHGLVNSDSAVGICWKRLLSAVAPRIHQEGTSDELTEEQVLGWARKELNKAHNSHVPCSELDESVIFKCSNFILKVAHELLETGMDIDSSVIPDNL